MSDIIDNSLEHPALSDNTKQRIAELEKLYIHPDKIKREGLQLVDRYFVNKAGFEIIGAETSNDKLKQAKVDHAIKMFDRSPYIHCNFVTLADEEHLEYQFYINFDDPTLSGV